MTLFTNFEHMLSEKKILITGHTGFTGSWASLWLQSIGSETYGFSLPAETSPALFNELKLNESMPTTFGDICDYEILYDAISSFQPDLILHLAAQPLVRRSYKEPLRTFMVNAQGTAHVLEAARQVKSVKGVLCITTDKVYKNNEWPWSYRENDPLGGKDPYSASKASAEMVIQSYMSSYQWQEGQGPAIAIARGGNIIGGGDWSEDRLIPDFVRAVTQNTPLTLRYPDATRPWQHVLSLVHGYLIILAGLLEDPELVSRAWNLGPEESKHYSVRDVLERIAHHWKRPDLNYMDMPLPESCTLALDSSLARNKLNWQANWNTEQVIERTASWYKEYYMEPNRVSRLTLSQINEFREGLGL